MKLEPVFLGTGAAEMYPNPFCGCETCERARQNRETRLRAAFLLDPASELIRMSYFRICSEVPRLGLNGIRKSN